MQPLTINELADSIRDVLARYSVVSAGGGNE
jgi:hypothetical protein